MLNSFQLLVFVLAGTFHARARRQHQHLTNLIEREGKVADALTGPDSEGGEDDVWEHTLLLSNMQLWLQTDYEVAITKYQQEGVLNDATIEELLQGSSEVHAVCQSYVDGERSLMQDGEGGAERMLTQYFAEVQADLKKTGWKRNVFALGTRVLGDKVLSPSDYVAKKLNKITLKLLTLLEALEAFPEEVLRRGSAGMGEGWNEMQTPIAIVSPLQYPFQSGPVRFRQRGYGRVSTLRTVRSWPGIPNDHGMHLVYHGTGMLPIRTAGNWLSCGAYDFDANQGHGMFTDFDPFHAPMDYIVGSQMGKSAAFREAQTGYIWQVEAEDFRGLTQGRSSGRCYPSPDGNGGIGSTVNSDGWLRFTMQKEEDMQHVNYFDRRGLCRCKLRINNVFSVTRWMRNILIDYHKGTKVCKEENRCPRNMVGTWD